MQHQDKSIGIITPFVNQKNLIEKELKLAQMDHVVCGTVHAFQGDEKDIILFSTAITDQTQKTTYEWLKNNKELINVATSRAKDKLILMSSRKILKDFIVRQNRMIFMNWQNMSGQMEIQL